MAKAKVDKIDFFIIGPVSLPEFNTRMLATAHGIRQQGFTCATPVDHAPDDVRRSMPAFLRRVLPVLCASQKILLFSEYRNCPMATLLVYMAQRIELEFYCPTTMDRLAGMQLHINFAQVVGDRRRAELIIRELAEEEFGS